MVARKIECKQRPPDKGGFLLTKDDIIKIISNEYCSINRKRIRLQNGYNTKLTIDIIKII